MIGALRKAEIGEGRVADVHQGWPSGRRVRRAGSSMRRLTFPSRKGRAGFIVLVDREQSLQHSDTEGAKSRATPNIQICFDPAGLLREYDSWGAAAGDLRRRRFIEVRSRVRSLIRSVRVLQTELDRIEGPLARRKAKFLRRLISEVWVAHPNTVPVVLRFPPRINPTNLKFTFREFPVDGMQSLLPMARSSSGSVSRGAVRFPC